MQLEPARRRVGVGEREAPCVHGEVDVDLVPGRVRVRRESIFFLKTVSAAVRSIADTAPPSTLWLSTSCCSERSSLR